MDQEPAKISNPENFEKKNNSLIEEYGKLLWTTRVLSDLSMRSLFMGGPFTIWEKNKAIKKVNISLEKIQDLEKELFNEEAKKYDYIKYQFKNPWLEIFGGLLPRMLAKTSLKVDIDVLRLKIMKRHRELIDIRKMRRKKIH
ncbi:MAG: hypothetical protein DWQ02_23390 [Bacteroidetes bacterium]|nr:MAG: hypothetical protein DWQ02_23390 [Bacteroidota bacterium]